MKKHVLPAIIVVVILVGGVFVWRTLTEVKPFNNLSASDILEATVSVNYYGTVGALNEHEINELVNILRKVVTYNKDNSHSSYVGGQNLTFTITKKDGTKISIMGHISTIVIDEVGYETKGKPLEALHKLGSSLEWNKEG